MLSLEPVYDGAGLSCSRVDLSICEPHFFIDSFADEIIKVHSRYLAKMFVVVRLVSLEF